MGKLIEKGSLFEFNRALDAVGEKYEGVTLPHFRAAVWAVFERLVYTTPQFSGRAAANWNIGLDAPDFSFDPDMGEQMEILDKNDGSGSYTSIRALHVGHEKWAEESLERNRYKLQLIKSNTRVYITNASKGDPDTENGRTSPYYLSDLQDPSYWINRLRLVNMPYETVTEVLLTESWRQNLNLRGDNNDQRFFK